MALANTGRFVHQLNIFKCKVNFVLIKRLTWWSQVINSSSHIHVVVVHWHNVWAVEDVKITSKLLVGNRDWLSLLNNHISQQIFGIQLWATLMASEENRNSRFSIFCFFFLLKKITLSLTVGYARSIYFLT